MKLTIVFKDAKLPKKINFSAVPDEFEISKIRNTAARVLKERSPENSGRKYEVQHKY